MPSEERPAAPGSGPAPGGGDPPGDDPAPGDGLDPGAGDVSDHDADWGALRDRVIGLGERSMRKSYYPELVRRLGELERFRALLDHSRDAILLLEVPSLRIVDATSSALGHLRRSCDALVELSLADLVPSASIEAVLASVGQVSGPGDGATIVTAFRLPDGGELPVEMSVRPVRFNDTAYAVAVARDLTERLELEARLLQAAKMESLGRLAGGIAHDFNNLLTAILGNSELARSELPAGHPAVESIDQIVVTGERASDLIRQLLVFARRQVITPVVIDLNGLVAASEAMLRRLLGEDVEVQVRLEPTLPPVLADASQLQQLLVNLTVNARDAMPDGGRLAITTSNLVVGDNGEASALGLRPGSYIELAVSDTGVGMTDETLTHIFEPFYTTKELGKGTGFGLATCHGIVRQIGGAISATSAPGRGTTFRILLPAAHGATAAPAPDVADARREGTETILVVEDDDAIRRLAAVGLRRRGYQVLEASGGRQALEIAASHPYDLAVSDVVMPGMSGAELGRHLRSIQPEARLILASGHPRAAVWASNQVDDGDDGGLGRGRLGAPRPDEPDGFLAKPYTPERLAALVRRVLDGRRDEA